ncbi:hypothetical protein HHK36_009391 [Tetracentron sinense]|uniref:ABC1 atypical kinase-like domain-containing protein n=1 Tax=Tetracentron sinense TaxID=13715 RepID=A0A835DID0_TETSI|nr:hypothetical protein HHK36_009391 [Tetracentron sinense]
MLLVLPPFASSFPANFKSDRQLKFESLISSIRFCSLCPRSGRIPAVYRFRRSKNRPVIAAALDVDTFTKYSGYLFELSTSEADSLTEYDVSKIASIYRRKPFILVRRLFQISTTLGRWFGLRYLDRVMERSDQMFEAKTRAVVCEISLSIALSESESIAQSTYEAPRVDVESLRRVVEAMSHAMSHKEAPSIASTSSIIRCIFMYVRAAEFRKILVELGPAYVKIAQAISSRPDLIPPSYLEELSLLQDRITPFSTEVAFNMIEQELGLPIDMLFSEISPEPVAAASLGQVYQARLRPSGQVVAVKVQRPGVQAAISLDILILRFLAGLIRRAAKLNTDLQAVVDEWASSLFRVDMFYL